MRWYRGRRRKRFCLRIPNCWVCPSFLSITQTKYQWESVRETSEEGVSVVEVSKIDYGISSTVTGHCHCKALGDVCNKNGQCCSKICNKNLGRCSDSECKTEAQSCRRNSDCCLNKCDKRRGKCSNCRTKAKKCNRNSQCCSNICNRYTRKCSERQCRPHIWPQRRLHERRRLRQKRAQPIR